MPISGRVLGAALLALGSVGIRAPVLAAPSPPEKLAGVLPCDQGMIDRWGLAGAWIFPVGSVRDPKAAGPVGVPGYRLSRSIEPRRKGNAPHEGVDLDNRRAGDPVRAAASGLVVCAELDGKNGYGVHLVIAHRLPDGAIVYTVYAHLAPGSLTVRGGERISAGRVIGRVGSSGRATTAHLHFEVRLAHTPGERWEKARPLDPTAFVEQRLPSVPNSPETGPYLEWAACSALIPRATSIDGPLLRAQWWEMLARAGREPVEELPDDWDTLNARLIESDLLTSDDPKSLGTAIGWTELARGLARLERHGLSLPSCPVPRTQHRAACQARFHDAEPGSGWNRLHDLGPNGPTLIDACLLLADLCAHQAPATALER